MDKGEAGVFVWRLENRCGVCTSAENRRRETTEEELKSAEHSRVLEEEV